MAKSSEITEIIQNNFLEVTRRLASLEPYPAPIKPMGCGACTLLSVTAEGDYHLELMLCAEDSFLLNVASRMKRTPLNGEDETVDYLKEYFNVVCGRIVSAVNRKYAQSARIGLTRYARGGEVPKVLDGKMLCSGCYESECGRAVLRGIYRGEPEL